MKKSLSFLAISLTVISVFAKPAAAPEWMNSVRSVYPDSKYIAQKGSGKKSEEAKTDALAAIGRYFKTTVESNLSTSLKSLDDGKKISETTQVQNDIAVTSNVDLMGVEYSEVYYSKPEKTYYCVAFIERDYAWKQFVPKIEQEKTSFYEFYNEAVKQAEEEPLLASKYFSKARQQGIKFLEVLEYGRLLHEAKEKAYVVDREKIAGISKRQADAAVNSTMFLEITEDYQEIISSKIQNVFSKEGFTLARQPENSRYIINANVSQNMTVEGSGDDTTYTSVPSVEITISGRESQKAIFNYSVKASKKSVAYSQENSLKKAYNALADDIEKNLIKEFNAAIGGE